MCHTTSLLHLPSRPATAAATPAAHTPLMTTLLNTAGAARCHVHDWHDHLRAPAHWVLLQGGCCDLPLAGLGVCQNTPLLLPLPPAAAASSNLAGPAVACGLLRPDGPGLCHRNQTRRKNRNSTTMPPITANGKYFLSIACTKRRTRSIPCHHQLADSISRVIYMCQLLQPFREAALELHTCRCRSFALLAYCFDSAVNVFDICVIPAATRA